MYNPREVFAFVACQQALGHRVVLVTVMNTTGASVRNPGSHMAVCEDGSYSGSLSGGCIEAAVVGEAREVLGAGRARQIRFGTGSPYIDVRLPCGGSVDLQFCEISDPALGARVLERFDRREAFALSLNPDVGPSIGSTDSTRFGIEHVGAQSRVTHVPHLRLVLIGHAAVIDTLRELALATGAEVAVISPSAELLDRSARCGCQAIELMSQTELPRLPLDRWTGVAVLFHDHDWEPPVLEQVLASEAFYVGAMGSHKTHEQRRAALLARGLDDSILERVTAPIGVIPSMRDPETLAISVLAQVVDRYNAAFLA
jgi:xanthine dehydrogenase accessory factor